MASRTKAAPVGSAPWIQSERQQAEQFVEQDVEEFGYSVRNDLEWLNEHMAEVFKQGGGMTLADVFKTPGKLRGKTPRTAKKKGARLPLGDLFAPDTNTNTNAQHATSPPEKKANAFHGKVAHFAVAEDREKVDADAPRPMSRSRSPQRVGKPGNTDSGYHGMTEDEMDVDHGTEAASSQGHAQEEEDDDDDGGDVVVQEHEVQMVPVREDQARPQPIRQDTGPEGGVVSDESFTSAREELASRNASREELRDGGVKEEDDGDAPVDDMEVHEPMDKATPAAAPSQETEVAEDEEMADDTPQSPSDSASSPEKPLQRKSSFTFSALPAREPLTAKRSIGMRESQIDAGRHSTLAARAMAASTIGFVQNDEDDVEMDLEASAETKAHQKSTTQSLHERIAMLGKTKEPRTSKSIPQSFMAAAYPKLPAAEEPEGDADAQNEDEVEQEADDDDDWIAPSKSAQQKAPAPTPMSVSRTPQGTPPRPAMHQKSISTTNIPSPARPPMPAGPGHTKAQSVSNPSLASAAGTIQSTTPSASPSKKHFHEGPLSASKSKLLSAFRSAKNIFASSASASAAAKLEAHNSPSVLTSPRRDFSAESKTAAVFNMPGALYSQQQIPQSPSRPTSVISASPSRKTRSSNESDKKREKELKAQQKAADELERAREKERQKAAKQLEEQRKADEARAAKAEKERQIAAERPVSADSERGDMGPPPPPPKSLLPAGKLRAPQRLLRTGRNEPAAKPAPALIRVASQSQRLGQSGNAGLAKSQHESMAPPPPPKTGLRTASTQAGRAGSTAPPNARSVRALEAAARKKEADERAAARKLEQKREMDRKRAAKAEEDRRAEEERKAAEQARVQEARIAAQRKAEAEARRKEQLRAEQQRVNEEAQRARAAHELAEAIKRERATAQPAARGDVGGTLRQLAKNTMPESRPAVQPNPAKPAKRVFQGAEEEEEEDERAAPPPQRPGMQRGPPSYQQNDAKRRRTNEEEEVVQQRHSVMAPPKRPSGMRKESTLNKFPHGYTHAPPPAAHHAASSMFKATVTAQHQLQHAGKPIPTHPSQTVQMSNARIPFAENANPPAGPSYHQQQQQQQQTSYHPGGHENTAPGPTSNNKYKTPGRPAQAPIPNKSAAKSSPLYPNGESIQLPEIMTDSEDEDSEDSGNETGGFRAPSWVASPALRDLLTQQQLVDPETVFGPIAELKMEEVFKNGKNAERLQRFRERGSSARWVETGDAVTSAEKRRDMEMRERVVREGGWRFEPA